MFFDSWELLLDLNLPEEMLDKVKKKIKSGDSVKIFQIFQTSVLIFFPSGTCIIAYWRYGSWLGAISCPICRQTVMCVSGRHHKC